MIKYNQIRCVQDDPVLQEVVKASELDLPELALIPSATQGPETYKFWYRSDKIDTPIYVDAGEGVCSETAAWKEQRRELRKIMRTIEWCKDAEDAADSGAETHVDIPAETLSEEMNNIQRRMVRGLYSKESGAAPETLDDYSVIVVDCLQQQWNGIADITPAGGDTLTTGYLVFASTSGFHWRWAYNRMFNFGDTVQTRIKDTAKSAELGRECFYPGAYRFVDGRVSPVAKTEYDVVKLVNIPTDVSLANFFLDNVLDRVTSLVYVGAANRPNLAILPRISVANWHTLRRKEGIVAGGMNFRELVGGPKGAQLGEFGQVAVAESSSIPTYTGANALTGNANVVGLVDQVGDLNL